MEIIVSKSIVKYRQTEFHFRNSLHYLGLAEKVRGQQEKDN
jgi:hypothetical protein